MSFYDFCAARAQRSDGIAAAARAIVHEVITGTFSSDDCLLMVEDSYANPGGDHNLKALLDEWIGDCAQKSIDARSIRAQNQSTAPHKGP